jgi:hypothetical protein
MLLTQSSAPKEGRCSTVIYLTSWLKIFFSNYKISFRNKFISKTIKYKRRPNSMEQSHLDNLRVNSARGPSLC